MTQESTHTETAVLGGGCFWCVEAAYQQIEGVEKVVSGYSGGSLENPTYEAVCSGTTGHAEVVRLTFNPDVISFSDILEIFWAIHDLTTLNCQGSDVGPQYRSIILYQTEEQKRVAENSITEVAKLWPNPIVTEVVPLEHFYEAEPYHQNYFRNHPNQAYCQIIINPKLKKLRDKFHARLKERI
jgi:peptide-methionine (S)-S-oxide reductase